MAEQSVTLQPGESKVVSFEATPTLAKVYQVSVDGLNGSFRAIEVPAAKFVYVSDIRYHSERTPCGATYWVFEVDVQNQGGIEGACSCNAYRKFCGGTGGPGGTYACSDWLTFNYDPYCASEALVWKINYAVIKPGQTVTFSEGLEIWPYKYEWGASSLQVKFTGDAGEILSKSIRV